MPDLNIGVIEVAYTNETDPRDPFRGRITKKGRVHQQDAQRIQRWQQGKTDDEPSTTVTVAKALEEKYGLFTIFYDTNADDIAKAVVHSLEGALEDIYAGAPMHDPFAEAGQEVEQGFRQWLLQGEIELLGVEGVPTQASIERRSSRFKSGVGPSERPSFVDTGLLELSLKAWVD